MKTKILTISSFILKIIALVSMTLDHIGVALEAYYPSMPGLDVVYPILRILGRIAMPLFMFMVVEGVMHTKHFGKYILKLGIMAAIIAIAEIVMVYAMNMGSFVRAQGNIFMDLLLGALMIYCLNHKKIFVKFFAILPFVCFVLSSIVFAYEYSGLTIYWYPFFLRTQYALISGLLILGFYVARKITTEIYSSVYHTDGKAFEDTKEWRFYVNLISSLMIVIVAIIMYIFNYSLPEKYHYWLTQYQIWMLLAIIPLMLYNGKRGYNKKWFQIGCYLYYPVHLLVIYGVVILITKIIFGG